MRILRLRADRGNAVNGAGFMHGQRRKSRASFFIGVAQLSVQDSAVAVLTPLPAESRLSAARETRRENC
jgi:hypothetical protein